MRVCVVGGRSRVGHHLRIALEHRGHVVTVLSRRDGVDITRPATLTGRITGDAVVSLVGASLSAGWLRPEQTFGGVDRDGNLALLEASRRAGVTRFVYLSVFGDYPPDVAYVTAHRDVERALGESDLSWTAIRPTGFFSSFDVLRKPAAFGLGARIGSGEARTNPIHEADLAQVLADHLCTGPNVVNCGGPETLTRNAIARRLGASWLAPFPAGALSLQERTLRMANPRLADLLRFLRHVMTHDCIAPSFGTRLLS